MMIPMEHVADVRTRLFSRTTGMENPSGCWVFGGFAQPKGYALIRVGAATKQLVHRVSWYLHNGPIPDGMCVCHKCDNPPCVNPSHLFLGTRDDNNKDRARKGRSARLNPTHLHGRIYPSGAKGPRTTLTANQVREIRARYAAGGVSQEALAAQFGTTQTNISLIVRRKHWGYVPDEAA